jgi:hypothetical protein
MKMKKREAEERKSVKDQMEKMSKNLRRMRETRNVIGRTLLYLVCQQGIPKNLASPMSDQPSNHEAAGRKSGNYGLV